MTTRRASTSQLSNAHSLSNSGNMDGMLLGTSPPFGLSPSTLQGLKEARKRVRSPTLPLCGISDPELEGEYPQKRHVSEYMARDLSSHMSLQGPGSIGPAHSHHHMASVPSDPTGSATPTHTPAPQSSENTMPREMSAEMDGPTSQQLMSESSFLMSEPGVSIGPDEDGSPAAPNSTGAQGSAGQSWHAQQTGTTAGFASNPSAAVAGPGLRVSIGQQPMSPLEGVEGPAAGLPPTAIGAAGYQTNMQLSPGAGLIAPSPGRRLSESLFRSLTVGLNVSTPSGLGGGAAAGPAGLQHGMHSPFQRLGLPQLQSLETMPASPSDARFTFSDLRKTALLRSLLQRTEDTATMVYGAAAMDTSSSGPGPGPQGAETASIASALHRRVSVGGTGQEAMSPARPLANGAAPNGVMGAGAAGRVSWSGSAQGMGGLGPGQLPGAGPAAAASGLMRRVSSGQLPGLPRPPPPIVPPQYYSTSPMQGCISPPAHTSAFANFYGGGNGTNRVRGTSPSICLSHGHSDSCLDTANSMSTSDSSADSGMDEEVEQVARRSAPVNLSPAGIINALPIATFPATGAPLHLVHHVPGAQPPMGVGAEPMEQLSAAAVASTSSGSVPIGPAILGGPTAAQRIGPSPYRLRPGTLSTIPEGDFKIAAAAGSSPQSTSPPQAGGPLLPGVAINGMAGVIGAAAACSAPVAHQPGVNPAVPVVTVGAGPVGSSPLDRTSVAESLTPATEPQQADPQLLAHVRLQAMEETHKVALEEGHQAVHALPPSTPMLAAIAEHTGLVPGGHPPGHSPLADMHH